MDTSTFTHFCRANRQDILRRLAPQGLILIPDTVNSEVEDGRDRGYDIPEISALDWVEIGVLTPDEVDTQLEIKVSMPSLNGESARKHLGECAVLACAVHRQMVAVIDDRDGCRQASHRGARYVDSMWIIAEARKRLSDVDSEAAEQIYADLVATGMRLPTVESFIGWAYRMGLLPE